MNATKWLPGRLGSARIAILTIIDEEFRAARDLFDLRVRIPLTKYFVRQLVATNKYDIVLGRASDRGNVPAEQAVRDFIEHFLPGYVILVGIAGGAEGRDGIRLGDVIIADFIEYYEFMKIANGKMLARRIPYDHPSLYMRENCAEPLRYSAWADQITARRPVPGTPQAIPGHIAAGEKLFDDPNHAYQREILTMCDKALGVDMESFGIARAVFHGRQSVHYNPLYLVIRGVSDLVVTARKIEEERIANDALRPLWREYAANAASAFACAVAADLLKGMISEEISQPAAATVEAEENKRDG